MKIVLLTNTHFFHTHFFLLLGGKTHFSVILNDLNIFQLSNKLRSIFLLQLKGAPLCKLKTEIKQNLRCIVSVIVIVMADDLIKSYLFMLTISSIAYGQWRFAIFTKEVLKM